ncbi:hypothetical protein, partial [Moraxella bovoculi]|uniref:hypothetical protein n=1 Tax=Moraxella bovoculi TaxID=386891 RepID=UPI001C2D75AA
YIYSIANDMSSTLLLIFNYIFIFIIAAKNYSSNLSGNFWLKLFTIYTIFYFIFSSIWFFVAVKLSVLALNKNYEWYSFIYISIFPFYISFLSCVYFAKNMKNKINEEAKELFYYDLFVIIFISFIIPLMIISFVFQNFINSTQHSLYTVRFIEKPQDSSWYLIHNGNTASQTINGFTKDDIKKQKQIFNAKDCGALSGESKEKCQNDNKEIFNQRHNALYGYMAWNLGNTKVFCPVSVDFFITDVENESLNQAKGTNEKKKEKSQILDEKSKKCLVIDGKYLQPISEHYLAN